MILCAIDVNHSGEQILAWASEFASLLNAQMEIVYAEPRFESFGEEYVLRWQAGVLPREYYMPCLTAQIRPRAKWWMFFRSPRTRSVKYTPKRINAPPNAAVREIFSPRSHMPIRAAISGWR